MTGGPTDGAELYAVDTEPCLYCGLVVGVDWDGPLVWHFEPRKAWEKAEWCRGSRSTLEVPA